MSRILGAGFAGLIFTLSLGCGDKDSSDHTGDDTDEADTDTDTDIDTDTDADTDSDTDADADADFDMTFTGSGYNPHDGQLLKFALVDDADGSSTEFDSSVAAGVISESWTGAVTEGHSYVLYWFADLDEDGACTPPGADHGWSESIGAVTAQVDVDRNHSGVFEYGVCDHF